MSAKSCWIWHDGEYEIFHTMNVNLRRQEREYFRPPFWKVSTPYASVKFCKKLRCESGDMVVHINGSGHVLVDDKRYEKNAHIHLEAGDHAIEVHAFNVGGLPAIFVESDVCPSDGSWLCNHFAGEMLPVGYDVKLNSPEQNPEEFPFAYQRVQPVAAEVVEDGILFDFGRELFGYLHIKCDVAENAIGVFYGESREEALDTEFSYITEHIGGQKEYRLRQRAFRYVYLKGITAKVEISADYEFLPLEAKGRFACDNALFNKIYAVSTDTFHLNCREAFLDGIKRDRWVWSGDAYQSARINRYLFFDKAIEQRTLIGLIGKRPIEQHINTILDYSLLWIILLYEHYMTYGDKEFLSRIYPMAAELLAFCETRLNEDGFIEGIADDWTFIDWANIDKTGAVCAEQMLLIKAYAAMAFLSAEIAAGKSDEFLAKSEALKARTNKFFWNHEKGAYIDSYASGKNHVSRHANIFAIMYDIASPEQTQSILTHVIKNEQIEKITTPYFKGYELDVLAKLGEFDALEDTLESYWGGMIELGAQTVWEEYYPEMRGIEHYAMYGGKYEKSLCHAWGAGPIYLFGRYYVGVYPTSVAYQTFRVEPKLNGLKKFEGTAPINDGMVTVKWNEKNLTVTATRPGGTLVWDGKEYPLKPDEPIVIDV